MRSRRTQPIISLIYFVVMACFLAQAIAAQTNPVTSDTLLVRGDSLFAVKKFSAARKVYEAALKIDRDLIRAHAALGKIAIAEEKWSEAGDEFQNILDRDPENIEAHYYRGISTRETGKFKVLLLRKLDWDKSRKHFEWVMSRDSLYKDVLFQYAQLLRYREDYQEAIQMGHIQIRLRPDLVEPQVKLFRLYRYFITHAKKEEAIDWLKRQPWDHAGYAIGEKFRRDGELAKADTIFSKLAEAPLSMSRQPVYLSLARIYYHQNLPEKAENYYWQAIDEIETDSDADLVFEDVKYIVTDQELETYRSLNSIPEKIDFFKALWVSRDPMPAATINLRLAEHYRRLLFAEKNYVYDGFRTWFNNPDKSGYLAYTQTYGLNQEFNDKGLIYIRHGERDDWAVTLSETVPSNESWLYYKTQTTPKMIFHFVLENTTGFWRFTPMITDPRMLEDRLQFGNIYYNLLRASQLERLAYAEEMARESREAVLNGLSTDRHTWEKKIKPLEAPFSIATFRGKQGKTILEIYYAIALSQFVGEINTKDQNVELDKGITIHDLNWQPVEKTLGNVSLPVKKNESFLDIYRFEVPPDSYRIAFYVKPKNTNLLGGWKYETRVADYSKPDLSISDIQLATRIEPAVRGGKFNKNGLQVIPNPTRLFLLKAPVYIYFEIYQLTLDADGSSAFSIEYTLTHLKSNSKGLFSLFSRGKSSITTKIDREGKAEFSVEYIAVDVSKARSGEYELAVKVTDKLTGRTTIQTREVALH